MDSKFEYELRLKDPNRALKADYENSRSAAIDLHCRACVGGSVAEVGNCNDQLCALWKYRPGSGNKVRSKDSIPTKETYLYLIHGKKNK